MHRSFAAAVALTVATLACLVPASGLGAQEAPLPLGQVLQGSLAPGDTARYTLATEADFFVRGAVDQIGVDVVVRVLAPDGAVLRTLDGPSAGPEPFQFETDRDGAYRLEVLPAEDASGEYAIRLERLEPVATDPEELVDQLLSAYDGTDTPGAAVSVWRDGETLFTGTYGMANLAYGIPFEPDTRTNIGSTSKQFTAFAVMLLVERGELSLDDDVRTHVPELPDLGATVTVRHLLTHTSGYREFLNLLAMTGRRLDHGDFIDRAEVIDIVRRQPALQNEPGAEFNYNNTAFGLAAVIVERISEMTFPEFMEQNVFEPLGMTRTLVRASPETIVEDRSVGYVPNDEGGYREAGDLSGAVGAGAIYSTVADLKRWAGNLLEPRVGTPATIEEMTTSFVRNDGEETGYGLGLFIDEQRGLRRVHHGGADVAHRSMLVVYPDIGAGLTVQSNHALFDSNVAFRLAEAFFGDAMEPEEAVTADGQAPFDAEDYDAEAFDSFVGRYALDAMPSMVLTLSREGDALHFQATGQQQLALTPTSDTTFALVGVDASITMQRNDEGAVDALILHQNGDNRATRLEGDAADAWAPGAEELAEYAGRYFSTELETFYHLVVEDGELELRHRRLDDTGLSPAAKDTFGGGGLELSFERDRNGRIIGFYLSNVRTRSVRFERVDGGVPPGGEGA